MASAALPSTAASAAVASVPARVGGAASAADDDWVQLDILAWILNLSEEELQRIYVEVASLYEALPAKRADLAEVYTGLYGLTDAEAAEKIAQLETSGSFEDANAQEREFAELCAPLRTARLKILAGLKSAQDATAATGAAGGAAATAGGAAAGGARSAAGAATGGSGTA